MKINDIVAMQPDFLETIRNTMVPEIKLSEFKQNFWYAFTGRIADPEESRKILAFWVQQVAGNASTCVNVVDDVTGNKIAQIPPVLSSGHTNNLIELFKEIKVAREQSKLDSPQVAQQRLDITKTDIMSRYKQSYLKRSVDDWITLYTVIDGGLPEGHTLPDSAPTPDESKADMGNMEWE